MVGGATRAVILGWLLSRTMKKDYGSLHTLTEGFSREQIRNLDRGWEEMIFIDRIREFTRAASWGFGTVVVSLPAFSSLQPVASVGMVGLSAFIGAVAACTISRLRHSLWGIRVGSDE